MHFQIRPVAEYMGVGVDEARQNCGVAKIDDARAGGYPDAICWSYVRDPVRSNQNDLIRREPVRLAVKQPSGTDGDLVIFFDCIFFDCSLGGKRREPRQ